MNVPFQYKGYRVDLFEDSGPQREQFEQTLVNSGTKLPLPHRCAWARSQMSGRSLFIAVSDQNFVPACGFAIDVHPSRALPGHLLWHIEKFGSARTEEGREAALHALSHHACLSTGILRVNLEIFSLDPLVHTQVARVLPDLGFRKREKPRMYTSTLMIDLRSDEAAIAASLHPTARRHIRAVDKHPVALRPIEDPLHAARMRQLLAETMARTDGPGQAYDWSAIIDFSKYHPGDSRIVGLFRTDCEEQSSLLAFAWGRHHGDYGDYAVAASTRKTDLRIPLGYAPLWNLVCWAKRNGAAWFDLAGITLDHLIEHEPVAGISNFKRYFSKQIVTVGEEWVLEPYPTKARLAHAISSATNWVRTAFK